MYVSSVLGSFQFALIIEDRMTRRARGPYRRHETKEGGKKWVLDHKVPYKPCQAV